MNLNKIFLLFVLMLMFANNGTLGKSLAFGNYAVIQGIYSGIHKTLTKESPDGSNSVIKTIKNNYSSDQQKILPILDKINECAPHNPDRVTSSTNSSTGETTAKTVDNEKFKVCYEEFKTAVNNAKNSLTNATTKAAFSEAAKRTNFIDMSSDVKKASMGYTNVEMNDKSNKNESNDVTKLLLGWNAALAIVPDMALIGGLLFFPFPLALSFFSTSYLQTWISAMWSVGLFKFIMTIFYQTFTVIPAMLAGQMPQYTTLLLLGIVMPTIAIALATGSGLGLSSLVSQGVSTLSSKVGGGSVSDRVNNSAGTTPIRNN